MAKPTIAKPLKTPRRSSFEIAEDAVELNFLPIIEADKADSMTPAELRHKRRADKKRLKEHHYLRNSIIAAVCLGLLAIGTALVWWKSSSEPVDIADKQTRQFVVDKGTTTDEIATALQKAGFIRNKLAFMIYARLHKNVIQAGTHVLSPSYKLSEVVARLTTADSDEIEIQIPPGLTLKELTEIFKKYDYTDQDIETALKATYDNSILADRPDGVTLEGYIYPDTYRVFKGDKLEVLINKAITQLAKVANQYNLQANMAAHGLSFYQGVTLASIVTKEVQTSDDQKTVAGVFYNRLATGMSLGSDVTYKYAYKMGLCTNNTPDCDSAYNTRLNLGLPPGPIANPSLAALLSVANPTDSNYFYFVAGEDGNTYYSETADQHNQAVADHCGDLCQ